MSQLLYDFELKILGILILNYVFFKEFILEFILEYINLVIHYL